MPLLPTRYQEPTPNPGLNQNYYDFDEPLGPRAAGAAPPPRRHKSEKHRRARSPSYASDNDYKPRRGQRMPSPGQMNPPRGRRYPSPPPIYFAPSPPPQRDMSPHHDRDPYPRESYPGDSYPHDSHNRQFRDHPPPEPRERHHRSDRREPPPKSPPRRSRNMSPKPMQRSSRSHTAPVHEDRGRDVPSSRRYRDESPPLRRSRGAPPHAFPAHDSDDSNNRRRRHHRSQPREADAGHNRSRGHAPPVAARPPLKRRSTTPTAPGAGPKGKGNAWWKHPLVQAGARTAFAAGAQAIIQNRKEEGPWLGSKGVKVATTALTAAIADGMAGGGDKKR